MLSETLAPINHPTSPISPLSPPVRLCARVCVCVCVNTHTNSLSLTHTKLRTKTFSRPLYLAPCVCPTYHRQVLLTSPPPPPLLPSAPCSAAATVTTPALLSAAPFTVKSLLEEGPAHSSGKISLGDTLVAIDDQVECPLCVCVCVRACVREARNAEHG
jgi:hypothetical protein